MDLLNRLLLWACVGATSAAVPLLAESGFVPIFDGRTLDGWETPELSYWSVEEGAIHGAHHQRASVRRQPVLWFGKEATWPTSSSNCSPG